jgi:hypothetical protein
VCFPRAGDNARVDPTKPVIDPAEHVAAILTGWALAWGMRQFGIPAFPCIMAGLIVCAYIRGGYRRRWREILGHPEPGS